MDIIEYRQDQHEKRMEAQDAKIDRIEAAIGDLRVSLVRVEAGLATVAASVSSLRETVTSLAASVSGLRATVILTGLGAVALVVAVLAYGQTWFGIGVSTRDIVRATVAEMRQEAASPKP